MWVPYDISYTYKHRLYSKALLIPKDLTGLNRPELEKSITLFTGRTPVNVLSWRSRKAKKGVTNAGL